MHQVLIIFVLGGLLFTGSLAALGKAEYAEKGTAELMGVVSMAFAPDYPKVFNLNFAPTFNYFFVENWYFGGDFGLYYYYFDSGNYQSIDANLASLSFSPSASLGYADQLSKRLYWFAELGYGYALCLGCQTRVLGNSLVSSHGLKYDLGAGLVAVGTNFIYNESLKGILRFYLGFSVYF
jgi:hypothetical protein